MKVIASNRRATYDYTISDKLIAGIVLSGAEVKSVKANHVHLRGSFITLKNREAFLHNAHIAPYQYAQGTGYEPTQSRKLLLKKRELDRLAAAQQNGLSIVPLSIGIERGFVKTEIGIGRGKKQLDKRELIRRREHERSVERELKKT